MNRNELKQGEYYCWNYNYSDSDKLIINKIELIDENNVFVKHWISSSGTSYFKESSKGTRCNNSVNIRLATPEEKHWLNECIRLDKFITKEKAMETFNFIPKKGDYLYCHTSLVMKFSREIKATAGMYYKCEQDGNFTNNTGNKFHKLDDRTKEWFRLATKEECDAQFATKEPEFVLPKNWVLHVDIANLELAKSFIHSNKNDYVGYRESWSITLDSTPTYLHYPQIPNSNAHSHFEIQKDYVEITTEQFKKYVLKQSNELVQPSIDAPIEEILEYCKKKFPIGTKIKSIRRGYNYTATIRKELTIQYGNCISHEGLIGIYYYDPKNNTGDYNKLLVEIVEEVKQKPLKATVELRDLPKTYTLEEITNALTKEYDKVDVQDILTVIKTIK